MNSSVKEGLRQRIAEDPLMAKVFELEALEMICDRLESINSNIHEAIEQGQKSSEDLGVAIEALGNALTVKL